MSWMGFLHDQIYKCFAYKMVDDIITNAPITPVPALVPILDLVQIVR